MEQAGSVIHSTFAIDVIWSGGYEGARNECKNSEIHRGIEVVHFTAHSLHLDDYQRGPAKLTEPFVIRFLSKEYLSTAIPPSQILSIPFSIQIE